MDQANTKFVLRWNNYQQNQSLRVTGQDHKQPFFNTHWLDDDHNGFSGWC